MSFTAAVESLSALGLELAPGAPRRKFELAHMRTLAAALGDPQATFPSVLIAGTNGKGSTAATLASILAAAGYRTGLYTSPHLTRVTERIRLSSGQRTTNNQQLSTFFEIPEPDFARLYFRVDETGRRLVAEGKLPHPPSYFETLTALAFLYFAEQHVAIAILEVGLGGRLDATNIVEPELSIITDIALDHQEYLGPTIAAIAREKAGILRPGGTLITLPQHPQANQAIGDVALELAHNNPEAIHAVSATPYLPGRDFPNHTGAPSHAQREIAGVAAGFSPRNTPPPNEAASAPDFNATAIPSESGAPFMERSDMSGRNSLQTPGALSHAQREIAGVAAGFSPRNPQPTTAGASAPDFNPAVIPSEGAAGAEGPPHLSFATPDSSGAPFMERSNMSGRNSLQTPGALSHAQREIAGVAAGFSPRNTQPTNKGALAPGPSPLPPNHYTLSLSGQPLHVRSPLFGEHQQRNIALAIAAAVELRDPTALAPNASNKKRYEITDAAIEAGIAHTSWPGRLEQIAPDLLLDVAHNPAGAWTLRAALASLPESQPRTLLFSCLRDKDLREMAQILFPLFDSTTAPMHPAHRDEPGTNQTPQPRHHIVLTPVDSPRAASLDELLAAAHALDVPAHAATSPAEALALARSLTPPGGLIVATGSIYLVGALRALTATPDGHK